MMPPMFRPVSIAALLAAALPSAPAAGQTLVGADLRANARITPSSVAVGDDVNVIATVENHGPEQATDVTVVVTLPQGLVAQTVDGQGRPCSVDVAVTCRIGP